MNGARVQAQQQRTSEWVQGRALTPAQSHEENTGFELGLENGKTNKQTQGETRKRGQKEQGHGKRTTLEGFQRWSTV